MNSYVYSLIPLLLPFFFSDQGDAKNPSQDEQMYQYTELLGTGKFFSNKVSVEIDFGRNTKFFDFRDSRQIIDPGTGKPKIFNSM